MTTDNSSSNSANAIKPGTEPFSADGGPVGVLLSHGFTGSPASMRPWGEYLADQGMTVRVPRLPGHGTTWQDMNTKTWDDWYGELDAALTDLQSRCEFVAVGGLSMGGGLALRLAEKRPADVNALILVNPAIALKRFDLKFVPVLSKVIGSLPGIGNDIKKPGMDELGYDKTPLKALASQLQGWRQVRADLAKVTSPMLYFHSTEDHVVDDTTSGLVIGGVASTTQDYVRLTNSYHVATIDNDAELIFEQSKTFIDAVRSGERA